MTTQDADERFEIRDGQRPVTFTGRRLAESNSQSGTDIRWTELGLYRTQTGKYVIEKIGRSDVFHASNCSRPSKGERKNLLADALTEDRELDDFVPCPECNPNANESPVFVEKDIYTATVFTTVEEMIRSLYRNDRNNMPFLSHVAQVLLETAVGNDADVARIMQTPVEVQ